MSIDAQKDIELFDKIASKYAKKDYTISTKIIREYKVISSLDLLDNIGEIKTIVEIGCGIAAPYNYLPKYINFDKYIGLDHSSEMIENAKKLHKNDKRISFECTDIKEYDKFNEADLVIALGVLHHVTDVDNFLKILYEQIGENTQVLFFEPISTNKLIGFVRDIRKKIDNTYSSEQVFFEPEELFNLMKTNGFKNINFNSVHYSY